MFSLLFQMFIGGIIISTLIFYAALFIASRHADAAAESDAQLRSIRTVTPYTGGQARVSHAASAINSTSVGTSSIGSSSIHST
ncbi:MAG: hypothetical protein KDE50_25645 [Caldilineaceae bacterium]|nr:hypothetical protein [Caldilineaceae bacterium]MCB0143307.1 hypothetical protein [Caldilineaceae bacterium]